MEPRTIVRGNGFESCWGRQIMWNVPLRFMAGSVPAAPTSHPRSNRRRYGARSADGWNVYSRYHLGVSCQWCRLNASFPPECQLVRVLIVNVQVAPISACVAPR